MLNKMNVSIIIIVVIECLCYHVICRMNATEYNASNESWVRYVFASISDFYVDD